MRDLAWDQGQEEMKYHVRRVQTLGHRGQDLECCLLFGGEKTDCSSTGCGQLSEGGADHPAGWKARHGSELQPRSSQDPQADLAC